jgi:hypothetical protein
MVHREKRTSFWIGFAAGLSAGALAGGAFLVWTAIWTL